MNYVKINLAQIGEEVSELVGYPIRQFKVRKQSEGKIDEKWIDEHALDLAKEEGYKLAGENRTGYCPPKWIAGRDDRPGIFNLDDWTRGSTRTIQAVMEIIARQEYISWKLPKGWTVVLTANPDDGEYLVNSIDTAQKTRFITANLTFDIACWGRYAESIDLDGRCINFLLMHPELVSKEVNPRAITNFFNAISSFKDFSKNLTMIQNIGEGSVGGNFAILFTLFINNKLDQLIDPKTMITDKDYKKVKADIVGVIGTGNNYRADIASVLATRVINYSLWLAQKGSIPKEINERLIKLSTEDIFTADQQYVIIKNLIGKERQKFQGLMLNEAIQKMSVK